MDAFFQILRNGKVSEQSPKTSTIIDLEGQNFLYEKKPLDFGQLVDWTLYYPVEWKHFFEENMTTESLKKYFINQCSVLIDEKCEKYYYQVNIKSHTFFVFLTQDFEHKIESSEGAKIVLGSPKLSRELLVWDLQKKSQNFTGDQFLGDFLKEVQSTNISNFPKQISFVDRSFKNQTQFTHYKSQPLFRENVIKVSQKEAALIRDLYAKIGIYKKSTIEKFSDFSLKLTTDYDLIRIHLLKFLAILPALEHDKRGKEVKRILIESLDYLIQDSEKYRKNEDQNTVVQAKPLPGNLLFLFKVCKLGAYLFPSVLLAPFVRWSVRQMASRFIAGKNHLDLKNILDDLKKTNRDLTLDQLGELVVSEEEALNYLNKVLTSINDFEKVTKPGEKNQAGLYRAHISIKVSALSNQFRPEAYDYTYKKVAPKLREILILAQKKQVYVNIDAEHMSYRDLVFKIYSQVLIETPELKTFGQTGIVLQAYLKDALFHLEEIYELAKKRNLVMPIRLVKGAYWDQETIEMDVEGHPPYQFLDKRETDINFRKTLEVILQKGEFLQLCVGSHNVDDHCFSEVLRTKLYPKAPVIEHQCLHMTYEALSWAMSKKGWVVRNYVPIGDLIIGMAYLVRRIMENSSQVGVLVQSRGAHSEKRKSFLNHMDEFFEDTSPLDTQQIITKKFQNNSHTRYYKGEEFGAIWNCFSVMKEKMEKESSENSSLKYRLWESDNLKSVDIKRGVKKDLYLGSLELADQDWLAKVYSLSKQSYIEGEWSKSSYLTRVGVILRAAEIIRSFKHELAMLITVEANKTLSESYADVDEAIDFLNFYARDEVNLNEKNARRGEKSKNPHLSSKGVVAVICPWNFPFAIPCGMASAALLAGNHVLIKSAPQTPLCSHVLVNILHLAGVPKSAFIHVTGGREIGDFMVTQLDLQGAVFTGSKAVGIYLSQLFAKKITRNPLTGVETKPFLIAEMGGKNAIIVTENAELDETVSGILYSAFAHAGQKCSACSRLIVSKEIKDRLVKRLVQGAQDLPAGESTNLETSLNPLVGLEEKEKLLGRIEEIKLEVKKLGGRIHLDMSSAYGGSVVGPFIVELPADVAKNELSYFKKELFGPVIHVVAFEDLDEAVSLFNANEYALTGGIFSQSQRDIDYMLPKLEAGNIYINRTCTGARVAIEPFGGFKLSGTGPKAGGTSYLQKFHTFQDWENNEKIFSKKVTTLPPEVSEEYSVIHTRLKNIMQNKKMFYHFFETQCHSDWDNFKRFIHWMESGFINLLLKGEKNKFIPGQINYCDYRIAVDQTYAFLFSERLSLEVYELILLSFAMGVNLEIVYKNEDLKNKLEIFIDLLNDLGVSSESELKIYEYSEVKLPVKSSNSDVVYFYEGNETERVKLEQQLWDETFHSGWSSENDLIRFYSLNDDIHGYKDMFSKFVTVRSLAVNTMRYGASFSLEA